MAARDDETVVDPLASARPAGELAPGTLLNGIYRIEARLGVGGMGEVYRATNLANDEQDAIKIIGRGRSDQTVIEAMFRKEARVLSRIRSPAVAQLKLFLRDPELNLLYFITDFVAGESLLDRLKRQPASPDELRALMRRLLSGLQAVHDAGAVHRDLSPDNIILPDGDPAHAKIIDFGIAKELDPDQTTMIGDSFAGKLGYIAPEQLGFSGAKIGPWTDLYSLALVGVAFAAGKPLDMGHTVGRAEEARRAPIDLSPVPEDLRPVFERMLVYDWQERPQGAGEVLTLLDAEPSMTPARAPTEARRRTGGTEAETVSAPPVARRRRWLWLIPAAVLVLAALAAIAAVVSRFRSVPSGAAAAPTCGEQKITMHFAGESANLDENESSLLRMTAQQKLRCPSPAVQIEYYVRVDTGKARQGDDREVASHKGTSDPATARSKQIRQFLEFAGYDQSQITTKSHVVQYEMGDDIDVTFRSGTIPPARPQ